ncbi:MAG: magnesium transporter CorA family protein [Actinobacteria bacterium]|nr:magnesium transporter CorA family protein [Actinomycetota bacterium]
MSTRARKISVLTAAGLEEIGHEELPKVLATFAKPHSKTTWLHAELSQDVVQALDDMGLGEIAIKSLRDGPERPRVEEFADHLYVSLFSADRPSARSRSKRPPEVCDQTSGEPEPAACLPQLRELRLFLGHSWLVSLGNIAHSDYEELVNRMQRQVFSRNRGPSFVAYHISEWLVETLQPTLEELDDRIDGLEDQVVLTTGEAPMQQLFGLKRDIVELRRRVSPLRDVMQRLGSHGVVFVEPEAEVYFRDVHDDVMRAIELLDTYRDILSSALDLHLSSVSNRLNRVMKQLTVVATMFLPLTFIVGLFGTNFTRMPFGSTAWFVGMFVLMFVSVTAMWIYTWKRT